MSMNDGGLMDEECQGMFWELCDEGYGESAIAFLDANEEFIDLDCRFELTVSWRGLLCCASILIPLQRSQVTQYSYLLRNKVILSW